MSIATSSTRVQPLAPVVEQPTAVPVSSPPSQPDRIALLPPASMMAAHPEFPLCYYDLPPHARSVFSTCGGTRPKRVLSEPFVAIVIRSTYPTTSDDLQIRLRAQSLLREFPRICRQIRKVPNTWHDLYEYFDGVDLFVEGPQFLWYVIHKIIDHNHSCEVAQYSVIDEFARQWIASHEALVLNEPETKDTMALFDDLDRANQDGMEQHEIKLLGGRLNHYRDRLFSKMAEARYRAMPPSSHYQPSNERVPSMPYPSSQHANYRVSSMSHPQLQHPLPGMGPQPPIVGPREQQFGPEQPPHQNYETFMEIQRNSSAPQFNAQPTSNIRAENFVNQYDNRPRGWSHDGPQHGRARANSRFSNQNFGGGRWNYTPPGTTPPRQPGNAEPIYVLNNQRQSPAGSRNNTLQRISSEPVHDRDTSFRRPEQVGSQSSIGHGTFYQVAGPQGRPSRSSESPAGVGAIVQTPPHMAAESSAGTGIMFDDAKVLEAINNGELMDLPEHRIHQSQNSAITFFYGPYYERVRPEEQSTRTVYVGNVERNFFWNHFLKRMMSECGDVDTISWLPTNYAIDGQGHAFVAFMDKASVNKAIARYNNHVLPDGARLQVNMPRPRRERSNSHASQSNYQNSGRSMYNNGRDSEYRPMSRRLSVRSNQPNSYYHNAATQSRQSSLAQNSLATPVEAQMSQVVPIERLHSGISEVLQKNSALERLKMPLENIENRQSTNKKSNNQIAKSTDSIDPMSKTGATNKENSPTKSGPNSQTANRPAGRKSKKGPKQNTSTLPTPSSTPIKSRSEVNLVMHDSLNRNTRSEPQLSSMQDSTLPKEKGNFCDEKQDAKQKKSKGNKKKNKSSSLQTQVDSASTSFATESSSHSQGASPNSPEITSPVSTVSTDGLTMSKSTSFSSRKQSMTSSLSSKPSECAKENSNMKEAAVAKVAAGGTAEKEVDRKDTPKKLESTTTNSEKDFNKEDIASQSLRKKERSLSITLSQPSERKADAASDAKSDIGSASNVDAEQNLAPKIRLDDMNQFPKLQPSGSPPSAIADGKRPPPPPTKAAVNGSSSTKKQIKPVVPIVPVVPRTLAPRPGYQPNDQPVGEDELGSEAWPFVVPLPDKDTL